MTASHPDTIWAAQYGNTIAAENNPGSLGGDGMEYISRAAHDAAVSAARKEGMTALVIARISDLAAWLESDADNIYHLPVDDVQALREWLDKKPVAKHP